MNKILQIKGLAKSYGEVQALKGISFDVHEGSLFSFLGVNGAGKSTTIDIITTVLEATSGEVYIDGHQVGKEDLAIRDKVGVVYQKSVLDKELSVRQNLMIRGSFYSNLSKVTLKQRIEDISKMMDIEELMKRKYGKLSGGQQRKVDIARGLINLPKILILDEPTTGLDPASRKNLWETIERIQKETNMTIFLTTHYMEEAAQSDYIYIIDQGQIKVHGTPNELKTKFCTDSLKLYTSNKQELKEKLESQGFFCHFEEECVVVQVDANTDVLGLLNSLSFDSFEYIKGTLDDVFINITGGQS